jgi:ribose/xylose/arabinose/galactoside ABC-type transport system permease subunit
MFAEWLVKKSRLKSYWLRLILGSALTAFLISLGMVIVLRLLDFDVNSGIIGALAAIGAATYAARMRR